MGKFKKAGCGMRQFSQGSSLIFEDINGALNLKDSFLCGQAFRFTEGENGAWHGVANGCAVAIRGGETRLEITPASGEDAAYWRRFFALDVDYPALHRLFAENEKLAQAVAFAPGIRVLQQDFFEVLITFIISQNNNIPRIRACVEGLCRLCGRELSDGVFAFPTPAALAARTREEIRVLGAGYRDEYILLAAAAVAAGGICEETLRALPYEKAREELLRLKGVGPKVADCVLLFSLEKYAAYPRDVWMNRATPLFFPAGIPEGVRPWAGIAQQYIFNWARANL